MTYLAFNIYSYFTLQVIPARVHVKQKEFRSQQQVEAAPTHPSNLSRSALPSYAKAVMPGSHGRSCKCGYGRAWRTKGSRLAASVGLWILCQLFSYGNRVDPGSVDLCPVGWVGVVAIAQHKRSHGSGANTSLDGIEREYACDTSTTNLGGVRQETATALVRAPAVVREQQ